MSDKKQLITDKHPSGILNINKPSGMTSHDVINHVRRLVGIRKVGHAGTLDPIATGVLLVCVGQATRLTEYLMKQTKCYRTTLCLGKTTNTYDADGEIVTTNNSTKITKTMLQQTLLQFVGRISQIPPTFSAIKKNGVPLYQLARKGILVNPDPRIVHIEEIKLINFNLPKATIQVTCQSGTYIRSIVHDIGQALGVGAYVTELTRLSNGPWHIKQAISLEMLQDAVVTDNLYTLLHPLEKGLTHLSSIILSAEQEKKIGYGQFINQPSSLILTPSASPIIVAYNQVGQLVAILTPREPNLLKPTKVFKPN